MKTNTDGRRVFKENSIAVMLGIVKLKRLIVNVMPSLLTLWELTGTMLHTITLNGTTGETMLSVWIRKITVLPDQMPVEVMNAAEFIHKGSLILQICLSVVVMELLDWLVKKNEHKGKNN